MMLETHNGFFENADLLSPISGEAAIAQAKLYLKSLQALQAHSEDPNPALAQVEKSVNAFIDKAQGTTTTPTPTTS